MISSNCWVPRGYASEFPERYELNDEEMERINQMANLEISDAQSALAEAEAEQGIKPSKLKEQLDVDDELKEYDLNNYDENEESESNGVSALMLPGLSGTNATYFEDEDGNDPYLSLPNENDDLEEKQELQIYPNDNLILATRTEDEVSYLDVYIYDDGAGAPAGAEDEKLDQFDVDEAKGLVRESNLYVHHDILLPAFPLCVEWINYNPTSGVAAKMGNFAAIGTFDPQIEIWNLDYIDKAFPDLILGEPSHNSLASLSKKSKKKKKSLHVKTHHTDAILLLAHNRLQRSILASTSADKTLKLWNLNDGTAVRSLNTIHQKTIISSSQWNTSEESIILTGGYDGFACISDVRIAEEENMTKRYKVGPGEEVENVKWDTSPEKFYAGTDNGNVYCFDIRNELKPLWTLHAHDGGISVLDVNTYVPGLIVTGGMKEKAIKLWNSTGSSATSGPSMILSRDFGVGNVLSASFSCDLEVAGNLTVGGTSGPLKLWDTFTNKSVRKSFAPSIRALQLRAKEESLKQNRVSRIARKYRQDDSEILMTAESRGPGDDESDDEVMKEDMEEED